MNKTLFAIIYETPKSLFFFLCCFLEENTLCFFFYGKLIIRFFYGQLQFVKKYQTSDIFPKINFTQ